MSDAFAVCLPLVLRHEGGFVDDLRDPGGITNLGVTMRSWEAWKGRPATVDEMRALTAADVAPLYRSSFWDAVKADELPAGIDYECFDCAVNQGPGRARKWLQVAVGVPIDGVLGPQTLAAVRAALAIDVLTKIDTFRANAYRALADFPVFGEGWLNRLDDVLNTAQKMARGIAP